jgi:hypothetical protein
MPPLRSTLLFASAALLASTLSTSYAQTPGQMEYERQQREYWRQQEQQRQEQQRQQQIMQENARRQQEESRRSNASPGAGSGSGTAGSGTPGASGARGRSSAPQTASDNLSAARAAWEKKPPLPAEQNPLLVGKWTRPASTQVKSSDPFAGLAALAKGGLCEVLFGGGTFEFRGDRLMGMDARSPPQELDRVQYRGDSKHVVVIPKTTFKLMEFDVEGPNRINWKSQNCVLVRAGR